MLEDLSPTPADGVADDPAARAGESAPDGLDFLPDLLATLTADGLDDREIVTQLTVLETLTSATAAAKAVLTEALHRQRCASDASAGVPTTRRGRGVGHEVALARRESPWTGRQHVTMALVLTHDMPQALTALRHGDLTEEKAMILTRETADLTPADRRQADAELTSRYPTLSTKELTIEVRRLACRLDPAGAEERARRARERRGVTSRSVGDGMARLTGQIPAEDAIAAMQSLRDYAQARRAMGDDRTRDQLMADAFTDRLNQPTFPNAHDNTGNQARTPDADPGADPGAGPGADPGAGPTRPPRGVEIQLVMNADMLLGRDHQTPAHVPGHGPLPMGIVADLLATEELEVFVRRIYAHPDDNTLVAMDSAGILFRHSLRRLLFARDGDTCRTPGCNAPPRHGDHVTPRARGGPTTIDGGQGLCEDCNYAKEQPGWQHQTQTTWPQQHRVTITTPTGHTYDSHAPPLPVQPTTPATTTPATTRTHPTCEAHLSDITLRWKAAA